MPANRPAMKPETIEILHSPVTGRALRLSEDGQALVDLSTGTRFEIEDDIPCLLHPEYVVDLQSEVPAHLRSHDDSSNSSTVVSSQ